MKRIRETQAICPEVLKSSDFKYSHETDTEFFKAIRNDKKIQDFHYFLLNSREAILVLQRGKPFYFKGKIKIHLLGGKVQVLGYEHFETPRIVYSPKGSSLLCLEVTSDSNDFYKYDINLQNRLETIEKKKEISFIIQNSSEPIAVVLASYLADEPWIDFMSIHLEASQNTTNFFGKDRRIPPISSNVLPLENALNINIFSSETSYKFRLLQISQEWNLALKTIKEGKNRNESSIIVTVGGKGVGKSTLNRYLLNHCLGLYGKPILFIDVDPGQCELTIPGFVSASLVNKPLLGPNFCTQITPFLSYFVGHVNMVQCAERYLNCLLKLHETLNQDSKLRKYIWIINTMGFTKGLGSVLLVDTIRLFKPTIVINILSRFCKKNYDLNFDSKSLSRLQHHCWKTKATPLNYDLLNFKAIPESSKAKNMLSNDLWGLPEAKKCRDILILSHFGRQFIRSSFSLNALRPYKIHWSSLGLQILHENIHPSLVLNVFNGSIVSLSSLNLNDESEGFSQYSYRIVQPTVLVPSFGFGIVRAIDSQDESLYLLTSVSEDILQRINVLSTGAIFLPEGCFLQSQNKFASFSPYVSNGSSHPLNQPWTRDHKPRINYT